MEKTDIIGIIGGEILKLTKKIMIGFIFTIFLSIIAIFLISNYMINNRFEHFLETEQSLRFDKIHKEINTLYINNELSINEMSLMHYAVTENIVLIIMDNEENTIYNSENNMGHGMGMHRHRRNMMHRIPEGHYVEKTYPLVNGENDVIGTLTIGYLDNSYLTDSAIIFKETLTKSLLISGVIAIIIGISVSIILSRGLTTPIINITNTAKKMRSGDLTAKSKVITNVTEITELSDSINYLGETLSKQEAIRKRYASDISHELRTPLTTLKTHLEAIMDGVWEPTSEHLSILMNEVTRLSSLVNDLKDSFNQEEYEIHLNKTKFNISAELNDIITFFEPLYDKNNYKLYSSIENNIDVFMDIDKFKQIINNLLSNAFRYLNENGEVFVELIKVKNNIILTIRDNGIGIKKEDLPNIFERFYRIDTSRNKSTGGSGLGLPIVKSIVEAHNGNIEIKSEYGKGTEITIVLPLE